ncbi:dynein heavy chain, axonemal [Strigomonas culicis]|uniref:Dynein heavy chain, axonemal n=1 Tax=Strigomonas culicis TaxID=28005 RepID=S9W104_9TRYP|nr:dynein heavy chain, axonemal [Strigomonas culicis]|eukprot:EPY29590.1 dynein heavy chain, axonemal [Strigomonas culicis]
MEGVCNDVLYVVRLEPDKVLVPETMDHGVLWGMCRGDNFIDSFLRSLRYVVVPTLLANQWPSSIERDVQTSLHRFMATMVEDVNRLKGRTVLYVPSDLASVRPEDAHNDRELVQRYEATVIHWTRQIKEVVGDRDAGGSTTEDAGPLEEIGYWRSRAHDLGNIRAQLNRADVTAIVAVLREAKSFYYLEPFLNLRADIERGTEEAFDSLRYLNTLVGPSEELAQADPVDIPRLVRPILQNAQLILMFSKSYKKERFCSLLRLFSNEIIRRCSQKIDVAAILRGDVAGSMVALRESARAGEVWIRECRSMLAATQRRFRVERGEKLEVDESFLNGIDGFVRHRCQNLQEICLGQQQFGFKGTETGSNAKGSSNYNRGSRGSRPHKGNTRSSSGGKGNFIPDGAPLVVEELDSRVVVPVEHFEGRIPTFGGNRGPEIESQLMDIQRAFRAKMDVLRHLDYDILDVKSTKWVDDFRSLKADVDNLSMMLRQIITASFDNIATIASGTEYIEAFYIVSKNEELLIQLDRSKDSVFRLFQGNLKCIQTEMQRYFNRKPPLFYLHPPAAGQGYWASNFVRQIEHFHHALQILYYLPESPDTEEVDRLRERLEHALSDSKYQQYNEWKTTVPSRPAEYLDRFLLVQRPRTGRDVENPPLFDVNFARELLIVFEEVRYWRRLGELVPPHLQDICSKEDRLHVFRENVAMVTRAYNNVVHSLNKFERRLFSLRLQFLYTKFLPGLNKLWWSSQGIVEYFVRECDLQTAKVQRIVDDYSYTNMFIDHHCRIITDTLAVIFERKRVYTQQTFKEKQVAYREMVVAKLHKVHALLVDKLYHLFNYFREDYGADDRVRLEWHRLVEKIELKVEEALKTMVKRSLATVEKALPKETTEERLDEKVFRLEVAISVEQDTTQPIIHTVPSTRDLARDINENCKAIIAVVRDLRRLEECLRERVESEKEEELVERGLTVVHYETAQLESMALRGPYYEYMTGDQDAILSLRRVHESFESISERVHDKLNQTWQLHQSSSADNLWTAQKQDRRIKQGWRLEDYRINMEHVAQRRDGIDKQEVFADVLFLQLDFTRMKETFRAQCQLVIRHYHSLLYAEAKQELDAMLGGLDHTIASLTREPKTLDQLGEQIRCCAGAMDDLPTVSAKFDPLADKFALITNEAFNFGGVDPADVQRCDGLPEAFERYSASLVSASKLLEKYKEQFLRDLETDLRSLVTNSAALFQQTRDESPTTYDLTTAVAFGRLEALERRAQGPAGGGAEPPAGHRDLQPGEATAGRPRQGGGKPRQAAGGLDARRRVAPHEQALAPHVLHEAQQRQDAGGAREAAQGSAAAPQGPRAPRRVGAAEGRHRPHEEDAAHHRRPAHAGDTAAALGDAEGAAGHRLQSGGRGQLLPAAADGRPRGVARGVHHEPRRRRARGAEDRDGPREDPSLLGGGHLPHRAVPGLPQDRLCGRHQHRPRGAPGAAQRDEDVAVRGELPAQGAAVGADPVHRRGHDRRSADGADQVDVPGEHLHRQRGHQAQARRGVQEVRLHPRAVALHHVAADQRPERHSRCAPRQPAGPAQLHERGPREHPEEPGGLPGGPPACLSALLLSVERRPAGDPGPHEGPGEGAAAPAQVLRGPLPAVSQDGAQQGGGRRHGRGRRRGRPLHARRADRGPHGRDVAEPRGGEDARHGAKLRDQHPRRPAAERVRPAPAHQPRQAQAVDGAARGAGAHHGGLHQLDAAGGAGHRRVRRPPRERAEPRAAQALAHLQGVQEVEEHDPQVLPAGAPAADAAAAQQARRARHDRGALARHPAPHPRQPRPRAGRLRVVAPAALLQRDGGAVGGPAGRGADPHRRGAPGERTRQLRLRVPWQHGAARRHGPHRPRVHDAHDGAAALPRRPAAGPRRHRQDGDREGPRQGDRQVRHGVQLLGRPRLSLRRPHAQRYRADRRLVLLRRVQPY